MGEREASDQTQGHSGRRFTQRQRRYLNILSGGLCASCGVPLNGNFHADHVSPYSKGGSTTLQNGQALCPECNLSKGAKQMTGLPTLYSWQNEAFDRLVKEWRTPDSKPLIAACPGAGKTKFSVYAAMHALKNENVNLVITVVPTVNIKEQWAADFRGAGLSRVTGCATNEMLRHRVQTGDDPVDGYYHVLVISYQQLAQDAELFAEVAKRYRVLVIADEVHHADEQETYGTALARLSELSHRRLSLSGTPFNSNGGALAMCESEVDYADDGRRIRRVKPTYKYSYGDAIGTACRPVEFLKVHGTATATFQSLTGDDTWQEQYDLAKKNTALGKFLDTEGALFRKMAEESLKSLAEIQSEDKRAGMLVVARDREHGAFISKELQRIKAEQSEWADFSIQEIYNDTEKAHKRIEQLSSDNTDIVVTVRMISEGVDIKRLRVGLYATDCMTLMYFMQFVGRFVRYETRLNAAQFARVIMPAHIKLLEYARTIEQMVEEAEVRQTDDVGEGDDLIPEPKKFLVGTETTVNGDGLIYRGKEENERALAEGFFEQCPALAGYRGQIPESKIIEAARQLGLASEAAESNEHTKSERDPGELNDKLVREIVKAKRRNGTEQDGDYGRVQAWANNKVGITRKDKMTPPHVLEERLKYLKQYLRAVRNPDQEDLLT